MPIGSNRSRLILSIVVLLYCVPLFFINVKDSHDWGGDFAMYIKQANNIAHGIPHYDSGYIYNENYPMLGPPAYTAGFPLMLAPISKFYGIDIKPYILFNSFLLLLFAITIALLISQYNLFAAYILPLIIIYNPWTLNFKGEIVSDIALSLFLLLLILFFRRPLSRSMLLPGALLMAFTISIKGIGFMALASVILYYLFTTDRSLKSYSNIAMLGILTISFFLLFNKLVFPIPGSDVYPYLNPDTFTSLYDSFLFNSSYYIDVLQAFFNPFNPDFPSVGNIISPLLVVILLFGMIHKMLHDINLEDYFFVLILATLLFYPYGASGFRYLLPLTPMMLLYIYRGTNSLLNSNVKILFPVLSLITILTCSTYYFQIEQLIINKNTVISGPNDDASLEAFEFIEQHTKADDRFLFVKPRVLSLYTSRSCVANSKSQNTDEIGSLLSEKAINYILINNEISDEAIRTYVQMQTTGLDEIPINEKFKLYKIR